MFTGIVQSTAIIQKARDHPGGRRLSIARGELESADDLMIGESIAINGACMTLAALDNDALHFDVIAESLGKTNLGELRAGDAVNIERSLRVGDRIDGHFVQGHVDGVGKLVEKSASEKEWRYTIDAPTELVKYLSPKGSICVDGVSLTIASLQGDTFDVALIPTTLKLTTLAARDVGYRFNLECDTMAKQIVTFLEQREAAREMPR